MYVLISIDRGNFQGFPTVTGQREWIADFEMGDSHHFYHSKEAIGSQIASLVKVIGEEELIERTGGPERRIVFKETTLVIHPT